MTIGIDDIRKAQRILDGRILRTPLVESEPLSRLAGARVWLKLETLQPTGSFKVRGACVKLESLSPAERRAGVVAASAGNHGQGVAYFAQRLGIPATVVMPRGTPLTKLANTQALGARVFLEGDDVTEARTFAERLVERDGLVFVHPYDDEAVIAGQGTIGLEILADAPSLDCIVVPIGGGGLAAGIALAAKALEPSIEIVGVEAALYPWMRAALRGERVHGAVGRTVAEGIAVKQPGRLTRPIIAELVSDIVLAAETDLERAIYTFLADQRLVVEGAGAAPLAALMTRPRHFAGRTVCLVVSGGNIDSMLLSSILLRGLSRDGRLVGLRIELPDSPGALARVSSVIGEGGGNIVEVHHRRLFYDVPVKMAEVDVVLETRGAPHVRELTAALEAAGFRVRPLPGTAAADAG